MIVCICIQGRDLRHLQKTCISIHERNPQVALDYNPETKLARTQCVPLIAVRETAAIHHANLAKPPS